MPSSAVISDIGHYAIVPEWLLDTDVSPQAIRLFAVLAVKYADRRTDMTVVHRARLARDMHVSMRTVARSIPELLRVKALTIKHRRTAEGDLAASQYVLHFVSPRKVKNVPTPKDTDVPTVPDVPRSRGIASPLPPKGGGTRSVDRGRRGGLRSIGEVLREASGA